MGLSASYLAQMRACLTTIGKRTAGWELDRRSAIPRLCPQTQRLKMVDHSLRSVIPSQEEEGVCARGGRLYGCWQNSDTFNVVHGSGARGQMPLATCPGAKQGQNRCTGRAARHTVQGD
eukprot:6192888-Pleurochrysis_carterae.AAC.1